MGNTGRVVVGIALLAGLVGLANGAIVLNNGSFELPTALGSGAYDFGPITGWTQFGNYYSHVRLGNGFDYANAVDGTTKYSAQSDNAPGGTGGIFQDLGTMTAGQTYTFSGTIYGNGAGSAADYRIGFQNVNHASTLVSITQANFAPPAGGSIVGTFNYAAQAGDAGDTLRLVLEAPNLPPSGQAYRTGIDMVSVTGGTPPPPPPTTGLWSVDLQSTGALPMAGVEPAYGRGNIWNMVEAPHYAAITPSKSQALNDSNGTPTGVTFSVLTPLSTLNAVGFDTVLTQDFFLFGVGGLPNHMDWEISGLTPGAGYEMYNYRAPVVGRDFFMSIDTNGDGTLDTTQSIVSTITGSGAIDSDRGALFSSPITADPSGVIRGSLAGGGEVNWSGFQLRLVSEPPTGDIPEPATMALFALGCSAIAARIRRRRA